MLVILTEEESMEVTLRAILPKLGLQPQDYQIVAFQGKSDLEASLVRRVRAWRDPRARFLVLRDNDNGNCAQRKARLQGFLQQSGSSRPAKVRIIMQGLEAWFLGDVAALRAAGLLAADSAPAWTRQPPFAHQRPCDILDRLDPTYGKVTGARRIAGHLSLTGNTAPCFHATLAAIRALAPEPRT